MSHINCPRCGPNPIKRRSEYRALDEEARFKLVESLCERCWNAFFAPVTIVKKQPLPWYVDA